MIITVRDIRTKSPCFLFFDRERVFFIFLFLPFSRFISLSTSLSFFVFIFFSSFCFLRHIYYYIILFFILKRILDLFLFCGKETVLILLTPSIYYYYYYYKNITSIKICYLRHNNDVKDILDLVHHRIIVYISNYPSHPIKHISLSITHFKYISPLHDNCSYCSNPCGFTSYFFYLDHF